jgi:hypothetical protein
MEQRGETRSPARVEVNMVQTASVVFAAPSGHVLSWGWFSIELANLLIIVAMVVLFVVALLAPFGRAHPSVPGDGGHTTTPAGPPPAQQDGRP